jgi:alkanesulfonate monooxygenase SsuD/methylene tetrahydromethanopterin reductase-like flavin-dependent oxidoreductase (luciferase family)
MIDLTPEPATMTPTIGYHASHEQFAPSALAEIVRLAEAAGFAAAMCADHFAPAPRRRATAASRGRGSTRRCRRPASRSTR